MLRSLQIAKVLTITALFSGLCSAQRYLPATMPSGDQMPMPADPKLPNLWLVGDSTMYTFNGKVGWGTPFEQMFDKTKINVVNRARGGRSSRSFQTEGLWDQLLSIAKKGDYVLLQMGHNDGNGIAAPNPARGTLPGIDDATMEVPNAQTQKAELMHSYGWYMAKYASDAKAKGMIPIICSPIPHRPNEKVAAGDVEKSPYVGWSEDVAKRDHVLFIHLNKIILSHYAGMEMQDVKSKYFIDGQHTTGIGAELNALSVVEGIKGLKEIDLSKYLIPELQK